MTSRVVILGGTGFLGSHLSKRLHAEGFDVVSVGRRTVGQRDAHLCLDVFEIEDLAPLLSEADFCVHLVTDTVPSSAEKHGYGGVERNLNFAFRLADACIKAGVRKLLFSSSGGTVYGQDVPDAREDGPCAPIGLYGMQKLAVETALRSRLRRSSCKLVNLRIANPYGAGQERQRAHGLVGHLLAALIKSTPFTVWGDGTQVRDYVHVDDVIEAFFAAMSYAGDEDVFNVGSGAGTSTNEMIRICEGIVGNELSVTHGAHPAYDVDRIYLNIDKSRRHLGWTPKIAMREGIERYYYDLTETVK
ncbi:NAD-dependent epimerase/dehydratase family protein [Pseudoxanthomonas winnipegensis]|uniref:NAD-dependent epimerase/dehydratase family protein n=1 Tax=Pseudoxanthomonas winnipegensis TaxID=2480810 RepID=UPI0025750877|nr:NAD-dependent epimerase/dehydratase family protein [Pseudoxanthomonas winnipegensis]WJI16258.1 NAD-dependent epimerase/dehydratase family protein [Pseudoxanthomonas winnipegensis]